MIAYLQEVNRQLRRKRSAATQEHNKKAKKAKKKVAKKLQINSGPFNPYILQKDRQLTTEEKRIHLGDDHFLNEPSTRTSRCTYSQARIGYKLQRTDRGIVTTQKFDNSHVLCLIIKLLKHKTNKVRKQHEKTTLVNDAKLLQDQQRFHTE